MRKQLSRVGALVVVLLAQAVFGQVFVYPRRAYQSSVRYFDFDWETRDLEIPVESGHTGKVRLYFYTRERAIAERAAAVMTEEYVRLAKSFKYVPTRTFPYVLYSSYQEFLQTNLFPLQEGVLGVTSPRDLVLTLPYLGDDRLFKEVSAHEMTHQFTIQKVQSLAADAKLPGDPLNGFPLWFIEGLAEFYAKDGNDPEAEMDIRDLVVNPDPARGYALIDFFEDRPGSVLWTYKAGHIRCAFLEAEYGEGFLQRMLDSSVQFVQTRDRGGARNFYQLLSRLTKDDRQTVSRKFETWLKRRAYKSWLGSAEAGDTIKRLSDLEDRNPFRGIVTSLAASPDGNTLMVRTINTDTFQSELVITSRRSPGNTRTIAADGVPGYESLHPIGGRNFALGKDRLAFFAESRSRDVLYLQPYTSSSSVQTQVDAGVPAQNTLVRIDLGARTEVDLSALGLLAAYSPAFSPDGRRLAFVGMNDSGVRDVYILELEGAPRLTPVTNDLFAEREVSWGKDGVVYSSDATSHGYYNLFRVRPEALSERERLTTEDRDANNPVVLPDGRIFFTAYTYGGANLYEVTNGQVFGRTDVATGLFDASPAPGGMWALLHRGGEKRVVRLANSDLESNIPAPQPPAGETPFLEKRALGQGAPYQPFAVGNWQLGPVFGIVGGGTGGIAGELMGVARDRMGNHALVLNVAMYGSPRLTDGYLLYVNQERRITWAAGPFQSLRFRDDQTFEGLPFHFTSGEQYMGALGSLRYPLDRFHYTQLDLSIGSASYFLLPAEELFLADPALNRVGQLLSPWRAANEGSYLQTEATLLWGFDTLRADPYAGPLAGTSLLLDVSAAVQPRSGVAYGNLRLDGARFFALGGTASFSLRGAGGTTMGGRLARQFFLSSFDTLRGVPFGDASRLLGRDFAFGTAELRVPLGELIRVAFLSGLYGIAGLDVGGIGDGWTDAYNKRVVDAALGVNIGLGPFVFRLHFAKNINVYAPAGVPVPRNEWVTNLSLRLVGSGDYLGYRDQPGGGL
ncbi:MAG: tolB protein precursor protein [Myxococcaceae bacterium]